MHTSSSSCHTPAADVIEWEWLVIFYLMDVFHVVYKVVCAPPPISLVSSLKNTSCGSTSNLQVVVSDSHTGSVFGLLLFFIYIDGICDIKLSDRTIILFADDLLLYSPIKSAKDLNCYKTMSMQLPTGTDNFLIHKPLNVQYWPGFYENPWTLWSDKDPLIYWSSSLIWVITTNMQDFRPLLKGSMQTCQLTNC